jgi:hypothetical protein
VDQKKSTPNGVPLRGYKYKLVLYFAMQGMATQVLVVLHFFDSLWLLLFIA